jgi:GGDEF domain-containing protein
LPGINTLGLEEVGEKIRSAVTDLDFIEIPNLHISVTIGGAVQLHQSDQQLLFRADKVLFKAKEKGRNRVMITSEV